MNELPSVPHNSNPGQENVSTQPEQRTAPRAITLGISVIATGLLLAGLMVVPAPYAIKSPGPTKDTLGGVNSEQLIQIKGDVKSYESTGQLRLTTVGVAGGPGFPVNFAQVIGGWLDPTRAVYPVETVFPQHSSKEEIAQENAAAMTSSQENATYAALSELGYEIPVTLKVQGTLPDSPALDLVQPGDVITAIDGTEILNFDALLAHLDTVAPGTNVTVGITRDGTAQTVEFATAANTQGEGSRLGIALQLEFDFPVDVEIKIDNIGGPSAGMIFALGIMDRLTTPDETNGEIIAGTGTMDTAGNVGPIGGIRQKLHGAQRDGAKFFLAPESNCDEVVGNVPDGLQVVSVATLEEAWDAVIAIGDGAAQALPTCS